jgi:hypothetical protein
VQKQRERDHFHEFSELYLLPEGDIDDNRENPDFLIRSSHLTLGIEHVEYVREQKLGKGSGGSPLRIKEVKDSEFVLRVRKEFERKNSIPIVVSFTCPWERMPTNSNISQLADEAVALIEANLPEESHWKSVRPDTRLDFSESLEDYVASISICRPARISESIWLCGTQPFWHLQKTEIQALVLSKERNLSAYRSTCDDVWLLIVAPADYSSSMIDYPPEIATWSFSSDFSKVFLYDRIRHRIVCFAVTNRPHCP